MKPNIFTRLGITYDRVSARISAAWDALTGKTATPLTLEQIMDAITALNDAIAKVTAYLEDLKAQVAAAPADQTPAIQAATAALDALLPPAA